jgi:tetratricopeptide (TPR) repeat protein
VARRIVAVALAGCALIASPLITPDQACALPPALREIDRVERLIARGTALQLTGDNVSALAFFRDAVSAGPRDPRGYDALGRAYLALSEPGRAQEAFEAGVQATGGNEALWLGLFAAHRAAGQPERALVTIRRLVVSNPELVSAKEMLLDTAMALGRWVEALAAARSLLDMAQERGSLSLSSADLNLRVRALEKLLGAAERVRSQAACAGDEAAVRRALGYCP